MIVPDVQVYIGIGWTDMRKSINGLALLVSQQWSLDVFTGHMFAFTNRRRTVVKVLYWDATGFALWQKRLDKARFKWPESREEVMRIGQREFRWLLDGLDISVQRGHATLSYSAVA